MTGEAQWIEFRARLTRWLAQRDPDDPVEVVRKAFEWAEESRRDAEEDAP
jgi:hypothetical protein